MENIEGAWSQIWFAEAVAPVDAVVPTSLWLVTGALCNKRQSTQSSHNAQHIIVRCIKSHSPIPIQLVRIKCQLLPDAAVGSTDIKTKSRSAVHREITGSWQGCGRINPKSRAAVDGDAAREGIRPAQSEIARAGAVNHEVLRCSQNIAGDDDIAGGVYRDDVVRGIGERDAHTASAALYGFERQIHAAIVAQDHIAHTVDRGAV